VAAAESRTTRNEGDQLSARGPPMKILTIHNKYKFRGGEDESRESEDRLLIARGHEIRQLIFDNKSITWAGAVRAGLRASWSFRAYRRVYDEIRAWKPDILDVHNFFPLASPAVHYAGRRLGVPVVQTLHNYRLFCPGALLFRKGAPCEDCMHSRFPWRGVVHRCYRGSALQTSAVSLMIGVHRTLHTWEKVVSQFIAVSEFEKRKFVEAGFSESKITVKPNFVLDAGPPGTGGGGFVFVGRLTPDKGVRTLLAAMGLTSPSVSLAIAGDGPLESEVRGAAAINPRIRYLGRIPQREVLELLGRATALIFPSEWYETFGRVAAEAFARGTPVIAARIGAVAEIVDDGRTGFHFQPGDARDLARVIDSAHANPQRLASMRSEARREFELKYTAERNYELIMAAYGRAIANP
jgi:glycosyltransferase involved in cell wall biosynthesis